jgi:hypothetical protein
MKSLLHIALLSCLLAGCVNLKQNVQTSNPTGQIADNRWDYFNGSPVHYTSYHRTVVKDSTAIVNERTDKFAGTLNIQIGRAKAYFTLGDSVVELLEFEDRQEKDRWVDLLILQQTRLLCLDELVHGCSREISSCDREA